MTGNSTIQLREGTSKAHSMVENVNFVKSFLGGVVDKRSYSHMLANLYFVYFPSEQAMKQNKDNELFKPIHFPELNRTDSLKKDL